MCVTILGTRGILSGVEVWQTSVPLTPPAGTFYRAINVGGPAVVIDGNSWEGEGAPNYTVYDDSTPFVLKDGLNQVVPATVTYDPTSHLATLQPSSALNYATTYTATVKGGSAGVGDLAGNRLSADILWTFTTSTPPVAPTVLGATAVSATQIDLSWSDNATDETGYLLERKTGGAGTFAQIGTAPANATGYSDTTAIEGTTYIYRIRATNAAGNSSYSNEATATTAAFPWLHVDVGSTGVAGSMTYSAGTFTVKGSGADIGSSQDAFHFVYQTLTGNGQITARVVSLQNTNAAAKAGVMIRESLTANSKHAMMCIKPTAGLAFLRRATTGGSTSSTSGAVVPPPYWVRLVRSGSSFTAFSSSNGVSWTQVGSAATISMAATVQIGLAVNSKNNAVLTTAVFDNVSIVTPPAAPSALSAVAVANTQINLAWVDNATNETGFMLERKTGSGGTYAQVALIGGGVKVYSDNAVTAATTYFYRVRATNSYGNSAYSSETSVTTLINPPVAPTGLTATTASSSQINLSWTDVANETGYKIERKTGVGGAYSQVATVGAGVVTYSSTSLAAYTTYFYRVRAINAGGNSPYSNEASAATLDNIPTAPTNLVATAFSAHQINLSWSTTHRTRLVSRLSAKPARVAPMPDRHGGYGYHHVL